MGVLLSDLFDDEENTRLLLTELCKYQELLEIKNLGTAINFGTTATLQNGFA